MTKTNWFEEAVRTRLDKVPMIQSSRLQIVNGRLGADGRPLPDKIRIYGDINCADNQHLRVLPRQLVIDGSLNLAGCSNITETPREIYVKHSLDLSRADIPLPGETQCSSLIVDDNQAVTEIHDGIGAQYLQARGAKNLRSIPCQHWRGLDLKCSGIEAIPPLTEVFGSLDLEACHKLAEIGEGTTVSAMVNVRVCPLLPGLPESLQPMALWTDGAAMTSSGLHEKRFSILMPRVTAADAEMMIGRVAGEVISHHHLKNLEIMKGTVAGVRPSPSDDTMSSIDITPPKQHLERTPIQQAIIEARAHASSNPAVRRLERRAKRTWQPR